MAVNRTPLLDFTRVTKTYETTGRTPVTALSDVSFSVEEGEFVSILGPSGCGKSTLLKMVAGLTPVSSGVIALRGHAVDGPPENLGFVFQSAVLLDWRDVLGNVMLPLEILNKDSDHGRERALELLAMTGLQGFERYHPSELSGGMQQRVSICRALVFEPSLLLMDEPFGALDAMTREDLGFELLRIWEATKKTILFVTHSIEEAVLLSDRVVLLSPRPGEIADIVEIDLPRPRTLELRYSARFADLARGLRTAVANYETSDASSSK